ncbi:hypothetical protein [Sinorhizobium medicae]
MGLALFSMAMFIAMVAATINALRDETRDRATVLLPVAARRRRNQSKSSSFATLNQCLQETSRRKFQNKRSHFFP